MKLFAQHGFGDGEKVRRGMEEGLVEGVIFSAKDISRDKLGERLAEIAGSWPDKGRLFDPQYYVTTIATNPNIRLGNLGGDNGYPYFAARRRGQLESTASVLDDTRSVLRFQSSLPVTDLIAPNIFISRSFDSIEAAISKNFIRHARRAFDELGDDRRVFATLALSREALLDRTELQSFLNDITISDSPPDGFYILVGANATDARLDIYNADVIAGWLLLVHALKLNGFEIVTGYSDLVSPFLGAVGADVGGTGWFSTLRTFSIERFIREARGGRQPIARYLSMPLLNRISIFELDALRAMVPEIVNGLPHDFEMGSDPDRTTEVLQSWESLARLLASITSGNLNSNLTACDAALNQAEELYTQLEATEYLLERRSNSSHIEPLREGLRLFRRVAELF